RQALPGELFKDGLVLRRNAFPVRRVAAAVFPRMERTNTVQGREV
ncbi:MAG: hypothetical protein RLZZ399_2874, partial [Verrucomicrobiota bacterium]